MSPRKAFTLIELLVVIAILGLLLAVLLPTLGRIRKQARATACQMTLRHWGVVFSMYTNEYNDRFLSNDRTDWWVFARHHYADCNELLLCPTATRYEVNKNDPTWEVNLAVGYGAGSKFTAWRVPNHLTGGRQVFYGSYGLNWLVLEHYGSSPSALKPISAPARARLPFLLDCVQTHGYGRWQSEPPAYDGDLSEPYPQMKHFCIDRHDGAINTLFMDWSVRKVGLKEIWVLKWHGGFNTTGPWTKAGGVQAEDWPQWMRRFKDY
jgi:prepilin-type N-terminal cleavage/methylation domain-containing protein/prepilin-type processing-associated H-X9-DG protein